MTPRHLSQRKFLMRRQISSRERIMCRCLLLSYTLQIFQLCVPSRTNVIRVSACDLLDCFMMRTARLAAKCRWMP